MMRRIMNDQTRTHCTNSQLGLLFKQVRDAMWMAMDRELANSGLEFTFSQYITLKKLAMGVASVTELARHAELNTGAMTRLLDQLEARGLIRRASDPNDRRALHIQLTDTGLAVRDQMELLGDGVRRRAVGGLSDAEQAQLTRLLEHVRDNLNSDT